MENKKIEKIVVHPGLFHADEVCAVAHLILAIGDTPVVRRMPTDEELENPEVVVVDVGRRYEPERNNFDHHQRGGGGQRGEGDDDGVPFSSYGLIFRHYPLEFKDTVLDRVDRKFVSAIDATDCGWGEVGGNRPIFSFSASVSGFNPGPDATNETRGAAFSRAVDWVTPVLNNVFDEAEDFIDAEETVLAARTAGRIMILDEYVPWGEHVFSREDQEGLLYVIFPSARGGWMAQQIPKEPGSFTGRKPFPQEWAGLPSEELRKVTGVADATFCHNKRFCVAAESLDGVKRMAELSAHA